MQRTKYKSVKTKCRSGHLHDSKKEAERCNQLTALEKMGFITDLKQQVKFVLIPTQRFFEMPNERQCVYIADFVYKQNGVEIIEDTKGFKTPDYVIKRKLFKWKYCEDGHIIFKEL